MSKKEFVPVALVEKLAGQGKSEPEIIQQLRSQGFTPSQINSALKEALKKAVERPQPLLRPAISTEAVPEKFKPMRRPEELKPLEELKPIEEKPEHIGGPPEKMLIPPQLRPFEIIPEAEKISQPEKPKHEAPKHEAPKYEMPKHEAQAEEAAPAIAPPRQIPTAAPTMRVRPPEIRHEITLEELVEQIVDEHAKKVEGKLGDFEHREHELQQRLTILEDNLHNFQSKLDAHLKDSSAKLGEIAETTEAFAARFSALETAFKEFAQFMKRE